MIKQVRIRQHTDDWFQFRYDNGFGGSEIASVVSTVSKTLSDLVYTPALKLFLLKIGEPVQDFTGNVESESGHFFEPIILKYLKYFDLDNPDQLAMFRAIKANQMINKVVQPHTFLVNDKYPWLYYSTDAFHWKNKTGKKRIAECKNTTSMEARRYPNSISPSFYCQVMQGLLISELEAADLCVLIDGRWFTVITVEPSKEWFDLILDTSHALWTNIIKARKIKLEYGIPNYFSVNPEHFTEKQKEGVLMLSELEPELSGTEAELDFIKAMVIPPVEESIREGTEEVMQDCIKYIQLNDKEKTVEKEKKAVYEKLLLHLGQGFNTISFEGQRLFTYKPDKNSKCRLVIDNKINQAYAEKF